ncbi:MAG: hypothetical protein ACOC7J_03995, partial [Armatimonadota bacterium]
VSYHMGFEDGEDPVQHWVSNGEYEVNFKGVTDERAFAGRRSFKLDVTLTSGSYCYWHVPVRFPAEGDLDFSARVSTGEGHTARTEVGVNWTYPPTRHSGIGAFGEAPAPTGDWKLIEGDVVAGGRQNAEGIMAKWVAGAEGEHVGRYVDRWGIFIKGKPGQRAVIYIDDVRLEGEVPEDEAYEELIARRWDDFEEDWDARVQGWRDELAEARERMEGLPELPERIAPARTSAEAALARAEEMIDAADEQGYARLEEVDELEANLRMARLAPRTVGHIAEALERDEMIATFTVPAMTNARILPTEAVIPGEPGAPLAMSACRGEYESSSFVVLPLADVDGLLVEASDLTGDAGTIPADAIDLKHVKVWYQAGRGIRDLDNKQLVPELLLNDPALVRVDLEEQHNYLRSTAPDGSETYVLASDPDPETNELEGVRPIDAETLQPIDLDTLRLQQYWVTVRVPEDAAPGDYEGALTVSSEGNPDVIVPLELTVHPFELAEAPMTYSVYYRAKLHESGEPTITSEYRSEEQYLAEMRDCVAHGVPYPTLYQGYHEELLPRALELRDEAGIAKDRLFTLGVTTGAPRDEAAIERLRERVRQWVAMAERFGYEDLYVYGIDEAKGDRLAAQRAAWKAVQEEGAHTFVACYYGTFEAMGDLLDVAVLARRPDPEEAAKFHGVGSEVFTYAFPQVGPEEPETFRRNFGLVLWQANFDGAMDYAYQHGFAHVWNDFDSDRYRDHNFTYPTVDGVVDTVQWEGFREAVDDTRYMATLLNAIEAGDDADAKAAAQAWIDGLDPQRDLHEVRSEMVAHIERLLGDR